MKTYSSPRPASQASRGSILVTVLFVASILALLVAAVASDSIQTLRSVSQSGKDTQAKFGAYAGMEIVMNELRKQPGYTGQEELGDRHGRYSANLEELSGIEFEVLIWNNVMMEGEPKPDPLEGPNGIMVQADTVYMVASGTDLSSGQEVLLASMAGTARRVRPVFSDAAYARSKMVISGDSRVDAWDSEGGHHLYRGGGEGQGNGQGGGDSNVKDHQATLGSDGTASQTMRLLGTSELNGHYRVGPSVGSESQAFGVDQGSDGGGSAMIGGSVDDGTGTVSSSGGPVATAQDITKVKGVEGDVTKKAVVDEESTETPRFNSPFSSDDVQGSLTLNADPVENDNGPPGPPPAVSLSPGGYKSVDVPSNQTLALSPGVYYFEESLNVRGKIETHGHGPVIVFCGQRAVFDGATVNENGSTARFQLCFTDELKDQATAQSIASDLAGLINDTSQAELLAMLSSNALQVDPDTGMPMVVMDPLTGEPVGLDGAVGMSYLEMHNTKFTGSVSGNNLVAKITGSEVFGALMGNVVVGDNTKFHQDLSLKGSSLMQASGWALQGVHQIR